MNVRNDTSNAGKRIAKNTLILYGRMLLVMIINLYAVRVVWNALGVDDYGIYNVIGGIVAMFAFMNTAMVSSSQRFLSYELGTGDKQRLHLTFCISMSVHAILALIIIVFSETIGLWFVNAKLNIPVMRMCAANWAYQCSVLTFVLTVINVPYNACIVAHEHMKAYGYFGIIDAVLKLLIVFLLQITPFDKLISYAVLILAISMLVRGGLALYCRRHFAECQYRYVKDRGLMRGMFSFAGWSFLGNLGFAVRDQGLNVIINMCFNVAVNAAKGVATQVAGVVGGLAQNFQMAMLPQITKRYAARENDSMMSLVFSGCKCSGLLMMIMVVPIYFAGGYILKLWLGDVAPYTVGFMKLVLVLAFVDSMAGPITTAIQATGHIKLFQILICIIMVLTLTTAYVCLRLDENPYVALYVTIGSSVFAMAARVMLLHREVEYSYKRFIETVVVRVYAAFVISIILGWWLYRHFPESITGMALFIVFSASLSCIVALLIGLDRKERSKVLSFLYSQSKIIQL